MNMSKPRAAFLVALIAGATLSAGVTADAAPAPRHRGDCAIVAPADQALCRRVQRQHSYAWLTESGYGEAVSGPVLVHEITHQGLTKPEMHSYLKGEAAMYRRSVTHVPLDTDKLKPGCVYLTGMTDPGKPGGPLAVKVTRLCPGR